MPFTVVGDVTCADAPVTSHPVVPIAIVPTISDVFLKERRLFEPLNLYTLPPAVGSRSTPWIVRASMEPAHRGAHQRKISTLVSGQERKESIPQLSYGNGRIWLLSRGTA